MLLQDAQAQAADKAATPFDPASRLATKAEAAAKDLLSEEEQAAAKADRKREKKLRQKLKRNSSPGAEPPASPSSTTDNSSSQSSLLECRQQASQARADNDFLMQLFCCPLTKVGRPAQVTVSAMYQASLSHCLVYALCADCRRAYLLGVCNDACGIKADSRFCLPYNTDPA